MLVTDGQVVVLGRRGTAVLGHDRTPRAPARPHRRALLAALLNACGAADGTGTAHDAADVREDLTAPGVDLADGTLLVRSGEAPAAFATTRTAERAGPVHRLTLERAVHPGHRTPELLRRLLDWCRETGTRRHRALYGDAPLELHLRTHHGQGRLAEALDTAGYRRARAHQGMWLDLAAHRPAGAPPPDGTVIVPYADSFDAALLAARNAIFADRTPRTRWPPAASTRTGGCAPSAPGPRTSWPCRRPPPGGPPARRPL
ncbi:hypothetical protein [Streptomyces sp. NPDC048659]|uniref:hypothetical protein n=1 Tax=Streptomyces sp. NPDC048659 TaxID=3155489 RepID=UPI0034306372